MTFHIWDPGKITVHEEDEFLGNEKLEHKFFFRMIYVILTQLQLSEKKMDLKPLLVIFYMILNICSRHDVKGFTISSERQQYLAIGNVMETCLQYVLKKCDCSAFFQNIIVLK